MTIADLKARIDEIEAQSGPLRARYDAVSAEARLQLDGLSAQIKLIETDLFDLKQAYSRALKATGKVISLRADAPR